MMKVFLGGTCNESTWRERLISMLQIDYFNPIVDDWNEAAQQREVKERETCDFCLCTITPRMTGVYSIAEIVDDSNKRPNKTVLVLLQKDGSYMFDEGQWRSLRAVGRMVTENGGHVFYDLLTAADFLNKQAQ
jgi:hypothetical protein